MILSTKLTSDLENCPFAKLLEKYPAVGSEPPTRHGPKPSPQRIQIDLENPSVIASLQKLGIDTDISTGGVNYIFRQVIETCTDKQIRSLFARDILLLSDPRLRALAA